LHINLSYDKNYAVKKNQLLELAKFIVKENSSHHGPALCSEHHITNEIISVYKEDLSLFNSSIYYAAITEFGIVGSVKITLWDKETVLPLQKLFNVSLETISCVNEGTRFWHVGRLAISRNGHKEGVALLKKLLTLAIVNICSYSNGIMVAECDSKLLRGLNMMGIKTKTLAPSIEYLGSETIPVYATHEWLSSFLLKNDYVQFASEYLSKHNFCNSAGGESFRSRNRLNQPEMQHA